jgi:hypothetical protein
MPTTTAAHQEEETLGGSLTDYGETTVCDKDPEQPIEQKEYEQVPSTRRKPSFFQSLHVLKDPQFMSLTLANVTVSIGYLVPLYYMQSMFILFFPPLSFLFWALRKARGRGGRVGNTNLHTGNSDSHMIVNR